MSNALNADTFEAAWQNLKKCASALRRCSLSPSGLLTEIQRAGDAIDSLRRANSDVDRSLAGELTI